MTKYNANNPLEKSDDRAPLPINLLARLAFQWPDRVVQLFFIYVEFDIKLATGEVLKKY